MNANKNLGKKRKIAIVMVVLGAMYMSVYIEALIPTNSPNGGSACGGASIRG
jgi:hypothetical protein